MNRLAGYTYPRFPRNSERFTVKRLALAVSSAAVAVLALAGCSTTPAEEPTPTVTESATADPNAPKGFTITANGNPVATADGAVVVTGTMDGFQFFYAGTSPKLALTADGGAYNCSVQDGMDLASATAYAKGDLSAGTEAFMKEDNGNAFAVTLKDFTAAEEAHRFVQPAKGNGLLISCFGTSGATMLEAAWQWVYAHTDVITVDAASAGLIAGPSAPTTEDSTAPSTEESTAPESEETDSNQ